MNRDVDDLDESHRRDATNADLRPPRQISGTNNEQVNRSQSDEKLSCNGRRPPNAISSSPVQAHQHHFPPTYRVPQHLLKKDAIEEKNDQFYNDDSLSSSAKDLDAKMSGLQAAATKTALLINGKAIRKSIHRGQVVTTEEIDDDDQYSHWIFRRHVGFFTSEGRKTCLHDFPSSSSSSSLGAINGNYGTTDNLLLKKSSSKTSLLLSDKATTTEVNGDLLRTYKRRAEKSELLQQLYHLRRQRWQFEQSIIPTVHQHTSELSCRLSSSQQSYINALSTSEAVRARREWVDEELRVTSKCHVLSDVFLIWHRGPFGTINGFRLGQSALTMAGLVRKHGGHDEGQPAKGVGSSVFSWISSGNTGPATSNTTQNTNTSSTNPNAIPDKVQIKWNEINSALGQVLFLLNTLQNLPQSGISFRRHILQPCGSASKIGIVKKLTLASSSTPFSSVKHPNERRMITALAAYNDNVHTNAQNSNNDPSSEPKSHLTHPSPPSHLPGEVTWYNLHHYEENGSILSIGYYARRNFNIAMEGLLYCLAEAFVVVERRDMALAAPYTMNIGGLIVGKDVHGKEAIIGDSEGTVGGLPIAYNPAKGEEWTTVCKYLLTNLKWLVAFIAKYVDR